MTGGRKTIPGRWNRKQRDWGTSIWVSFLAACVGTFILFALLDPERLGDTWVFGWNTGVRLTLGLGFMFMFVVAFLASFLTAFMIRTGPGQGHVKGKGKRPVTTVRDPSEHNPDLDGENWS